MRKGDRIVVFVYILAMIVMGYNLMLQLIAYSLSNKQFNLIWLVLSLAGWITFGIGYLLGYLKEK